jgi:predicted RNA-binding protein (virulence factor B family)
MVRTGFYNKLAYSHATDHGIYLTDDNVEILLPKRYCTEEMRPGDELHVFIYRDSMDRLTATTDTPFATADSYGFLQVEEVTEIGAFFNWGLSKDLLMPHSQMLGRVYPGDSYVVRVLVDDRSDRIIATVRLRPFFNKDLSSLTEGVKIDCMVYDFTDLGVLVIINGEWSGLIHNSEFKKQPKKGDKFNAYIRHIRDDNKITVTFAPTTRDSRDEAKDDIIIRLEAAGGSLPFNDKSSPDDIKREFGMSKKSFKKIIGNLMKQSIITIDENGISLK